MIVVGKRVPMTKKHNAFDKAQGKAEYTSDLKLPRMLYAKVLRSPYAHAVVTKVDARRAEKLSGIRAVLTPKDVSREPYGFLPPPLPQDMFTLPPIGGKVRYVGDPVAAVAGENVDIVEEALELIDVEYEELSPVFDPEEAIKPDAPKIHPQGNLAVDPINIEFGDVEKGFKDADRIFEDTYRTSIQCHACAEPHSCVVRWDADGKLMVWTGVQAHHVTRHCISLALRIPEEKIRVVVPPGGFGGGFGSKERVQSLSLDIAALLAKKADRPVKIVYSREEEFACTETRHPAVVHLKTGVKKDGTLTARYSKTIYDTGAYASVGPFVYTRAMRSLALWKCANIKYEGFLVYTNKPVAGAFRGFGNPQHTFAVELQNDEIAEDLGIDPMEWRLKNHIRVGDVNKAPGCGAPDKPIGGDNWIPAMYKLDSCGLSDCIVKGAERIGWKGRRMKTGKDGVIRRGIGVACGMHTSGTMPSPRVTSVYIRLNEDGKIHLISGGCDHGGTGHHTVVAQILAEELGVPLEDITITAEDTHVTPYDGGTSGASGATYTVGGAVVEAGADLKDKLLKQAATLLKERVENLELRGGCVYVKGAPDKRLSLREVAERAQISKKPSIYPETDEYSARALYYHPQTNAPPFFADFAEVEVDIETGKVKVLKVVAAHDSGRAINPMLFEGQVHGGIQQGIGYALTEALIIDEKTGVPLNPTFLDYNVLTAADMPKIEVIIVETKEPTGPFGAKGLGEPCSVCVTPAIANAIYNAIGVRIKELPITPEKILRTLREKKEQEHTRSN